MDVRLSNESLYYMLATHTTIETDRLILRPITLDDAPHFYEYASDFQTIYYVFERHRDIEETKRRIANYFCKEPLGKYGIVLKEEGKLIGSIDLRLKDVSGELGYVLSKKYWGQGIVPEACSALLKLGFEKLHLPHIYATCLKENDRSRRVMEKIGMVKEAEIPKSRYFEGEFVSTLQYGITKDEYESRRKG